MYFQFKVYRKCRLCGEAFVEKDYQTMPDNSRFYDAIITYKQGYDKHQFHKCTTGKYGLSDTLGFEEIKHE